MVSFAWFRCWKCPQLKAEVGWSSGLAGVDRWGVGGASSDGDLSSVCQRFVDLRRWCWFAMAMIGGVLVTLASFAAIVAATSPTLGWPTLGWLAWRLCCAFWRDGSDPWTAPPFGPRSLSPSRSSLLRRF